MLDRTEPYKWDRTPDLAQQQAAELALSRTALPVPPARTVNFEAFSKYWNDLIKLPVAKFGRLYIRRWWPTQLPEEIEDRATGLKKESHPSEKKMNAEDGPLSEQVILTHLGVGDYTIRLNDSRLPWDKATIVHCERFSTARDWDKYPPDVDPARLDWDDPSNAVYIKWATRRGILKHPDDLAKEHDDMATQNVVQEVFDEARQARQATEGLLKEELTRTRAELTELKNKPAAPAPVPAPAGDLANIGNTLVSLVTAIKPAPDNTLPAYWALETEREKTRRDEAAAERARVQKIADDERVRADKLRDDMMTDMRARINAPPAAVPAPLTETQVLEEIVKRKELIDKLAPQQVERRRAPIEDDSKPDAADKLLTLAPMILPVLGSMVTGAFQFGLTWLQNRSTDKYNEALMRTGGSPDLKPPANMTAEPGRPIAPQPPVLTNEQKQQYGVWQMVVAGVAKLSKPMMRALDGGKTGAEFAEQVILFADEGRTDYDRIRGLADTLAGAGIPIPGMTPDDAPVVKFKHACGMAFQQIPELWVKVANLPSFGQFLEDFYDYDRIVAQEESEQQAQRGPAGD